MGRLLQGKDTQRGTRPPRNWHVPSGIVERYDAIESIILRNAEDVPDFDYQSPGIQCAQSELSETQEAREVSEMGTQTPPPPPQSPPLQATREAPPKRETPQQVEAPEEQPELPEQREIRPDPGAKRIPPVKERESPKRTPPPPVLIKPESRNARSPEQEPPPPKVREDIPRRLKAPTTTTTKETLSSLEIARPQSSPRMLESPPTASEVARALPKLVQSPSGFGPSAAARAAALARVESLQAQSPPSNVKSRSKPGAPRRTTPYFSGNAY